MFDKIKMIALDMDGVLTDGTILVLENGLQARRMSIRDGYALQLAVKQGLEIVVISGASAEPVRDRLEKLGITEIHMAVKNKWELLSEIIEHKNISPDEVIFMGDDIPDWEVMQKVALGACPSDAAPEIKAIAGFTCNNKGGEGCVRELLEMLLKAQGKWHADMQIPSR